ncbi:DUF4179 domain-containing protein [Evansella sp. AB-rgal1]|uniref:DUF4179 domain-containing protein n=1 Tax=Evansella sp. AB-rgal1 TaxID=3242696 RepID=UPI00359EB379
MSNNNDMKNVKDKLHTISPPSEVDLAIERGMAKGRVLRRNRKVFVRSTLTAAAIFILLITSIRVSPTFASALSEIPILNKLVEIVVHDDNLRTAIENDFIVPVDATANAHGIMVDIEGVIVDESRLVIFYSLIDRGSERKDGEIRDIMLHNQNGNGIEAVYSYWGRYDFTEQEIWRDTIEISFPLEGKVPETLKMGFQFLEDSVADGNDPFPWELTIDIPHEAFEELTQEFEVNKTIMIENQEIYIHEVIIYPTKTAVVYEYSEENEYEIYDLKDIVLVDGAGNEWSRVSGGMIGFGAGEDGKRVLFLDSLHFDGVPDELYLKGSKISALPKDKDSVIIDTIENKMLSGPSNMKIDTLVITDKMITLEYTLTELALDDNPNRYNLLSSQIYNEKGVEVKTEGSSAISSEEEVQPDSFSFNERFHFAEKLEDRYLHFTFYYYPNYLEQPWRIKIK